MSFSELTLVFKSVPCVTFCVFTSLLSSLHCPQCFVKFFCATLSPSLHCVFGSISGSSLGFYIWFALIANINACSTPVSLHHHCSIWCHSSNIFLSFGPFCFWSTLQFYLFLPQSKPAGESASYLLANLSVLPHPLNTSPVPKRLKYWKT